MDKYVSKKLMDVVSKNQDNPTEMTRTLLEKVWQPFGFGTLEEEKQMICSGDVPNSMLVKIPAYRVNLNDLADFIYGSVTGNSRKAEQRRETLNYWGGEKSPLEKLPLRKGLEKTLNGLVEIVKNGKGDLIDTRTDADIDYLANYLQNHKDLVIEKKVDLVPLVLASIVSQSLTAIRYGNTARAEAIEEYEKEMRPLVYGLIKTETFTSNKGAHQDDFSTKTLLSTKTKTRSNVQDQIIACLEQDGFSKSLIQNYFHNLATVSLLYDVDANANTWNGNFAERTSNSLVTIADDSDRLEPLSIWDAFEPIQDKFNDIILHSGKTESSLANASTVKEIYNELVDFARTNANLQIEEYTDDLGYAALAFARVLTGVAKAKSPSILREAQQEAASWKKMYNARVTRDGRKEQNEQPETKQTNETRGNAKNAQRNAEKDKGLKFFKGHTELTVKQRQLALKYLSGNTPVMLSKLGRIFGLRSAEQRELNPREVVSAQAIENLTGYLKTNGATKEEALHIAHYNALPVTLWTPETTIKEVQRLDKVNALAKKEEQNTEFKKMLRPLTRLAGKINNSRTKLGQATKTYWTETKKFADQNDHIRYDELIYALESNDPIVECKKLAPKASDNAISQLLALKDAVENYAPVSDEHQENVVKNFVKTRARTLIPDVKNTYNDFLVSTTLFKQELNNFAEKYNLNKNYLVKTLYPTLDQEDPYYGEVETLLDGVNEKAKKDLIRLLKYSEIQMDDLLAYCQTLEKHVDINKTLADVKTYIDGTEKVDPQDMYDIICDNLSIDRPIREPAALDEKETDVQPIAEPTTDVAPKTKTAKKTKSVEQQVADLAKKRAKLTQQYKNLLDENDLSAEQGDAVQDYIDTATTEGKPVKTQVVKDLLSVSEETKMLHELYTCTFNAWHEFIAVAQDEGLAKAAEEICRRFVSHPDDNMPYKVGTKKVTSENIKNMRRAALSYINWNGFLVESINGLDRNEEAKKQVKALLLRNISSKKPVDIIELQKRLNDPETV